MLTEAFSDCSTFAPSIGSENSSSVRAIGPSVSEGLRAAEGGIRLDPRCWGVCSAKPRNPEAVATRWGEYVSRTHRVMRGLDLHPSPAMAARPWLASLSHDIT